MRRAGEVLKQIEPGNGARDGKRGEGDHTPLREEVARDAGMSKHQQVTAVRVANIPERDFAGLGTGIGTQNPNTHSYSQALNGMDLE